MKRTTDLDLSRLTRRVGCGLSTSLTPTKLRFSQQLNGLAVASSMSRLRVRARGLSYRRRAYYSGRQHLSGSLECSIVLSFGVFMTRSMHSTPVFVYKGRRALLLRHEVTGGCSIFPRVSCSVGHWRAMASHTLLPSAAGTEHLRISQGASCHRGRIETCSLTLAQRRLDVLCPSFVFEQAVKLQYLVWAPEYGIAIYPSLFASSPLVGVASVAFASPVSPPPGAPNRSLLNFQAGPDGLVSIACSLASWNSWNVPSRSSRCRCSSGWNHRSRVAVEAVVTTECSASPIDDSAVTRTTKRRYYLGRRRGGSEWDKSNKMMGAASFVGRSIRPCAFAKANACGAIASQRAFSSTIIAQEAASRSSKGNVDVGELLSKPSWSVASLLPSKSETSNSSEISSNQLHHLLRLSALPPPKSPEEEQSMLSTLSAQLHFVKDIQAVDTTGVEPLRSLRDETAQGEAQAELGVEALKDALEKESVRGKYHKRIRRNKDVTEKKRRDWDPLANAHKKVGRFFVVEGEKSDNEVTSSSSEPAVMLDLFLAAPGKRLRTLQLPSNTITIVMEQQAIDNDAAASLATTLHSEHDFGNTTLSKECLHPRLNKPRNSPIGQSFCIGNLVGSLWSLAGDARSSQKRELDESCSLRRRDLLFLVPCMVQPPPGYVHARPCALPWCPGDSPAKTNQSREKGDSTKAKKSRPGKKRVEYSLYSKRVDEQEERDVNADDDDIQDDVSETPSCGQELFTDEDWYLTGFDAFNVQYLNPYQSNNQKYCLSPSATFHAYISKTQVPANLRANGRQLLSDALHVLVTSTGQVDDDVLLVRHRLGQLDGTEDCMRSLKSWDDTLELRQDLEADEGFGVAPDRHLGSPNRRRWSASRQPDLQDSGECTVALCLAVSRPSPPASTPSRRTEVSSEKGWNMPTALLPPPTQATTASGKRPVRACICSFVSEPITLWKVLTMVGKGCGPIALPMMYSGSALDRHNARAEQFHTEDIQSLATNVFSTHVDCALHAKPGTDGRGSYTVLTSTRLRNDLNIGAFACTDLLPHFLRQAVSLLSQAVHEGLWDVLATKLAEARRHKFRVLVLCIERFKGWLCRRICCGDVLWSLCAWYPATAITVGVGCRGKTVTVGASSTTFATPPAGAFLMLLMICDPITTPSDNLPTSTKCSRVLTPNPTAAGTPPLYLCTLSSNSGSPELRALLAPVTPILLTTYMKESAIPQRSFMRFSLVAGAMSGTYDSP
ncbi:hypothetical protein KC363_g11 [Hortaea werneckii]|nr:hypothetical protein KC363_g11 [Hortaea werneckii]